MLRRRMPKLPGLFVLLAAACVQIGCMATVDQTYFERAHDPKTGVTNFFRVHLQGNSSFSRTKYSVGFYDSESVERLFGERSIQQEFLLNRLETLSKEADGELKELQAALDKVRTLGENLKKERLQIANGTVAGLIVRYQTRFDAVPELSKLWNASLQKARAAQVQADEALVATPLDFDKVQRHIREAQVILESIRIGIDGSVLVRFFNGAGEEIPSSKTLVIFVASDASRFTEALKQLAESEEAKQNLLMAVLGNKIQESELAAKKVTASDTQLTALGKRLTDIVTEVKGFPATRAAGATPTALGEARKAEIAKLKEKILEAASSSSGSASTFKTADEIRGFAAGLGGGQ